MGRHEAASGAASTSASTDAASRLEASGCAPEPASQPVDTRATPQATIAAAQRERLIRTATTSFGAVHHDETLHTRTVALCTPSTAADARSRREFAIDVGQVAATPAARSMLRGASARAPIHGPARRIITRPARGACHTMLARPWLAARTACEHRAMRTGVGMIRRSATTPSCSRARCGSATVASCGSRQDSRGGDRAAQCSSPDMTT